MAPPLSLRLSAANRFGEGDEIVLFEFLIIVRRFTFHGRRVVLVEVQLVAKLLDGINVLHLLDGPTGNLSLYYFCHFLLLYKKRRPSYKPFAEMHRVKTPYAEPFFSLQYFLLPIRIFFVMRGCMTETTDNFLRSLMTGFAAGWLSYHVGRVIYYAVRYYKRR